MHAIHQTTQGSQNVASAHWQQLVSDLEYQALIFDCDGTLVESSQAHFNSFRDAVWAQGENFDQDWYHQRTGLDRVSLLSEFALSAGPEFDIEQAVLHSISAFKDHVSLVRSIPETSKLLRAMCSRLPIAVGTNAEGEIATASLTATGLANSVDHIVSISDGLRPKPSPDVFLSAATKLNRPPSTILVIEDSEQGVLAAKRAGMNVLYLSP